MKKSILIFVLATLTFCVRAETLQLVVEVPSIDAHPYHRLYLAVWLETPKREGVATLAVWHDDSKWLKDMRQWWRRLGRNADFDSATGATKPPGRHSFQWHNLQADSSPLPAGEYYLCVEAAREEGGREYLRQLIRLSSQHSQHYRLNGRHELGSIDITITP